MGKLRDLRRCLVDCGWELVSPHDLGLALDVEETGASYLDNARLKARAYFQASGLPTVGEDSGLEIDALGGAPGIYSARYQGLPDGPVKNRFILDQLASVPENARACRYRCALAFIDGAGAEHAFLGSCRGRIARQPAGQGGFGFDPIVEIPRLGRTLAELEEEQRLRINHRGRAARKLARFLATLVG